MSQPDWITKDVSEKLHNLSIIANEFTYGISKPYLPELIKLRGGYFVFLIFSRNFEVLKRMVQFSFPDGLTCKKMLFLTFENVLQVVY